MSFGAHFSIFPLRFNEVQLGQSLWHFRMSLLKACPATRCSYKCTVNPHWIHVSRESFGEMKLCLSSKIIMWYSVPQTVHFPDGKCVRIFLGGTQKSDYRSNPSRICFFVCVQLFVWVAHVNRESGIHQRRENELFCTPATVLHQDWLVMCKIPGSQELAVMAGYLPKWMVVVYTKW